jgi:hypothetical protein
VLIDTIPVIDGDLIFPLEAALIRRRDALSNPNADGPHPLAAYNLGRGAIVAQAIRMLDALDAVEARSLIIGAPAKAPDVRPLVREYQELIYRLAEHYEFLGNVPDIIGNDRKRRAEVANFEAKWKRAKRTATLICNKIKHNHNQLIHVSNTYPSGQVVHGFSLFAHRVGNMLGANKDLFPGQQESISFNLGIRSDLCSLFTADRAAAVLCDILDPPPQTPRPEAPVGRSSQTTLLEMLRRLDARPEVGFHLERSEKIQTVRVEHKRVSFGPQTRRTRLPPRGGVQISQTTQADGVTRSISVVDWRRS